MVLTTIKCWNSLLADGMDFLSPEVFKSVFQKYVHFMVCVTEETELEYHSDFLDLIVYLYFSCLFFFFFVILYVVFSLSFLIPT